MFRYNSPPPESASYSDYESEGSDEELASPRVFEPVAHYPSGNYANARLFRSSDAATRVVLSPVSLGHFDSVSEKNAEKKASFEEARRKAIFFEALYPRARVRFISFPSGTYRLILPEIPGVAYKELRLSNSSRIRSIMLSAVLALQGAHDQGYVTIDLKEDNILYDLKTEKSFLIDGGLAVKIGDPIPTSIFQCENQNKVDENRTNYFHLAPECWSTSTVMASEAMDVYSLANMIFRRSNEACIDASLMSVLVQCSDLNPKHRPTLGDLIHFLMPEVTPVVQAVQPAADSRAATTLEERMFFQSAGRPAVDSPSSPPALRDERFFQPPVRPATDSFRAEMDDSRAATTLEERIFFQSPGRPAVDSPSSPPGSPPALRVILP